MSKKSKKAQATSILPMAATIGLILGFILGASASNAIVGLVIGTVLGCAAGYYIDKKNGIHYGRKH